MFRRMVLAASLTPFLIIPAVSGPVARPAVLMVVGSGSLRHGDSLLLRRLESRGFDVQVREEGVGLAPADLAGKTLVMIAPSVGEPASVAALRDADLPLVVLTPLLLDELGMTAGTAGQDFGIDDLAEPVSLWIGTGHPLAASLSGEVQASTAAAPAGWGIPGNEAVVVAQTGQDPSHAAVFAYEAQAWMIAGRAPARRVGLFVSGAMVPLLTTAGWTL